MALVPGIRLFVGQRNTQYPGLVECGTNELKTKRKIGGREAARHGHTGQTGDVTERDAAAAGDDPDGIRCRQVRRRNDSPPNRPAPT